MDKLRQAAKNIRQTRDNTNQALTRVYKDQPLIERTRDVFDSENAFEMEFQTPEEYKKVDLSFLFQPGETIVCPPSSGCFQGWCDFYYNGTDTSLITTYTYIPSTTYVYKNDSLVAHTETGANQVTISSRLAADKIRVCYVYEVTNCFEDTFQDCIFDDFNNRTLTDYDVDSLIFDEHGVLGTASSGMATWEWDENTPIGGSAFFYKQAVIVENGIGKFLSKLSSDTPIRHLTQRVTLPTGAISNAWRDGLNIELKVKWPIELTASGRQGVTIYLGNGFSEGRHFNVDWMLCNPNGTPFPGEELSYPCMESFVDTWYTLKFEIHPYTESVDGTCLVRWKGWPENQGEPAEWLATGNYPVSFWLGTEVSTAALGDIMDVQFDASIHDGNSDTLTHEMWIDYIEINWPNKICPDSI